MLLSRWRAGTILRKASLLLIRREEGENMSGYLFEILLALENLDEKELEYVNVWTEYTLQKKEALSAPTPSEPKP